MQTSETQILWCYGILRPTSSIVPRRPERIREARHVGRYDEKLFSVKELLYVWFSILRRSSVTRVEVVGDWIQEPSDRRRNRWGLAGDSIDGA